MKKRAFYYVFILAVILLAIGLRLYAAERLDVDFDEPVYMRNAIAYAGFIRSGQLKMLAWYERTYEHPALNKIVYSLALLTQPPLDKLAAGDLPPRAPLETTEARRWLMAERYAALLAGSIAVAILAFANPLAGFFMGVSTLGVKYTSEAYLEALPLLTSLLCALAYLRWFENLRKSAAQRNRLWLFLSALFLGMTAASKYVYCIVGIVIVAHFLIAMLQKQIQPRMLAWLFGWGLTAMLMFFLFDPYLWPHPLDRLIHTIQFHLSFTESRIVKEFNYPFWQPFVWLSDFSRFYDLKPRSAFPINLDVFIFGLAIIGLPRLFLKGRFFFYWLLIGLSFLLIWTTKWPQYTMVIIVPFTVSASEGMFTIWSLASRYILRKRSDPTSQQTQP